MAGKDVESHIWLRRLNKYESTIYDAWHDPVDRLAVLHRPRIRRNTCFDLCSIDCSRGIRLTIKYLNQANL